MALFLKHLLYVTHDNIYEFVNIIVDSNEDLFVHEWSITDLTNHYKEVYNTYQDLLIKRMSKLINMFLKKSLRDNLYWNQNYHLKGCAIFREAKIICSSLKLTLTEFKAFHFPLLEIMGEEPSMEVSHPIMCDNRLGNMYNLRENMANLTGE
jgi:hypothetical protein